jgi:excisionase family DNA binding protein
VDPPTPHQLTIEDILNGEQTSDATPIVLDKPLLQPAEAAELLRVKVSWIYEAVRDGRLPCIRVGRHIRFTRSMLERWLAEHVDSLDGRRDALIGSHQPRRRVGGGRFAA